MRTLYLSGMFFFPLRWKLLSEVGLYLIWDLLFLVGLFSYSVTLYRCET